MTLLAAGDLKPHDITVFLVSLGVMLGLARLLGELARKYRQPAVLGEILAGVLLGPTVLGAISPDVSAWLFPPEGSVRIALDGFIILAATLLLLVVGLEVDLSTVWRQGKAALAVSALGIAFPFTLGFTLAALLPGTLGIGAGAEPLPFQIFLGIAMSITALPVIAKIMLDLNIAKSDMGMLILSSAMLNDLVGWIGFAVVLALSPVGAGIEGGAVAASSAAPGVAMTVSLTLVFLVLMLTVGRWVAHRLVVLVQAHWSWPGGVLSFVSIIALLCAAFTEYLGVHSIFGAFIAGVAIGDSHHLRQRTRDTIHQFITNIFAPIFFASIGLRVNFIESFDLVSVLIVFGAACVGKISGCYLGARFSKMSQRESLAIGFGMAAQGVVGIILGQLAREADLITDELLVAIVIMALATSLISGPAMQRILQSKQRRRLKDVLSDKHILIEPEAATVEQVIRAMAERAAAMTGLDKHEIAEAVLTRERIMHTGLPNGLAVPHARLAKLSKPLTLIARHAEGIDFDASDGSRARLIFLILTPTDQPDVQIELLGMVARAFADAETREQAVSAATPTEFLAVLNLADSEPEAEGPH